MALSRKDLALIRKRLAAHKAKSRRPKGRKRNPRVGSTLDTAHMAVTGKIRAVKRKRTPLAVKVGRFDARRALDVADQVLAAPPAHPWIERVEPRGRLVERFVLPLCLLPSTNTTGRAGMATQKWLLDSMKEHALSLMLAQARNRRAIPLKGRPLVRCIRFAGRRNDRWANCFKIAVDRLRAAPGGLHLIFDDGEEFIDEHHAWEPLPKGAGIRGGFGLIEVYTG